MLLNFNLDDQYMQFVSFHFHFHFEEHYTNITTIFIKFQTTYIDLASLISGVWIIIHSIRHVEDLHLFNNKLGLCGEKPVVNIYVCAIFS